LKPELERFLGGVFSSYSMERRGEPRELFCVGVKAQ